MHADLEFMVQPSFSGAEISLKFIDEYSNYVWVYALPSKRAVLVQSIWEKLCKEISTQYGSRVKALHTDNGGEFINSLMSSYNSGQGIHHHRTAPYRHEMNGRAERMNRTGSDAVRVMITCANLPATYWAEAYSYFAYIHNRIGRSNNDDISPYEILHQ